MKKKTIHRVIAIICAALMILAFVVLPVVALAESAPDLPDTQPNQQPTPYTWTYLGTIAGATAFTLMFVQFTKAPLDKVWRIPTRLFVYFVALVVMILAQIFTEGLSADKFVLTACNALIVAVAAYGAYELTFGKFDKK